MTIAGVFLQLLSIVSILFRSQMRASYLPVSLAVGWSLTHRFRRGGIKNQVEPPLNFQLRSAPPRPARWIPPACPPAFAPADSFAPSPRNSPPAVQHPAPCPREPA